MGKQSGGDAIKVDSSPLYSTANLGPLVNVRKRHKLLLWRQRRLPKFASVHHTWFFRPGVNPTEDRRKNKKIRRGGNGRGIPSNC